MLDFLTAWLVAISGVVMAAMALHIVIDVLGRYLFAAPLPGTVEIVSRYYMVVLVFLPLVYVQKRNAHFVAGLFTDRLPERGRQVLEGITSLAMATVAGLLAWCGISGAAFATSNAEQVQAAQFIILTWPGRWLMPLGLGLMAAYALLNAIQFFAGARRTAPSAH